MVKGSNVRLVVKALRARRSEIEPLVPEHLRHYLSERILPGSWYPEADNQDLMRVLASTMPVAAPACWRLIGQAAATDHATGLYAATIQGGARRYFIHFEGLWSNIHTSGSWRAHEVSPTSCDATLSDFPAGMPEYAPLMEGYLERILELCNTSGGTVRCLESDHQGARWLASWR